MAPSSLVSLLVAVLSASLVSAFIPASPSNATLDSHDSLQSTWAGTGSYRDPIVNLLSHNASFATAQSAILKGALVHFTEQNSTVQTASSTPWIALVKCDTNGSTGSYSMERDIFSLAYDHGAQAVVLYSRQDGTTSCAINPQFSDSNTFGVPAIDVWTVATASAAREIQGYFDNFPSDAFYFNAATLNASQEAITTALDSNTNQSSSAGGPSFVLSQILPGVDSGMDPNGGGQTQQGTTATSGGNGPNTGLAMIILYAITGCVTFMFLVVIMSGAIRAIRHPERYGPRARDPRNPHGGPGQSRAGGLTRAILDTFPVVKFGRNDETTPVVPATATGETAEATGTVEPKKDENDLEAGRRDRTAVSLADENVEMVTFGGAIGQKEDKRASTSTSGGADDREEVGDRARSPAIHETDDEADPDFVSALERRDSIIAPETPVPSRSAAMTPMPTSPTAAEAPVVSTSSATPAAAVTVDPAAVDNKSTCPICVCDFEDGDDLRILPCAGKHVFHKDCIDPWLLDVSSLCPLCRWDFRRDASESDSDSNSSPAAGPSTEITAEPTPTTPTVAAASPVAGSSSGFVRSLLANRSAHNRESTTATTASVHQHRFAKYLTQVRLTGPKRRAREASGSRASPAPERQASGSQ